MINRRVPDVAGRALGAGLLLLAGVASMPLAGCTSKPDIDLSKYVEQTDPADVLYNEGLANLNAGRLGEAQKKFSAVDREHPYTEFARKAVVMMAFTSYRQGDYEDAISSARRYLTLYPTSPEAAYAQYIIGLSYFKQIPDVTRDQTASKQTVAAMSAVVQNYPTSEYVDDARNKILFARDQLAGKEMQIGRYYLERKEYLAAIKRFRGVVENYSNTRQVEEALARLTEAYYAIGLVDEAQTAAAVLGRNFPESQWYKDSYNLLQSHGLSPHENKGSWLSKVTVAIMPRKP